MSDDSAGLSVEAGKAADQCRVITKIAIPVDLEPVSEHMLDVIEGVRPVHVAGQLGALPAVKIGKNIFAQFGGLFFKFFNIA